MGTFGTSTNPAHYVEVVDPLNAGQVKRPAAGLVLKARSYVTGGALGDITTGDYGYWSATYPSVDSIQVSGDGGSTWVGPLFSSEVMLSAASAGADSAEALRRANEAVALAQSGTGAVASVNGKTGSVTLSPTDVGARSAATPVPAGDVAGLALVGTTGKYSDLSGIPAASIPTSEKGSPNGTATLDATGKLAPAQIPPNVGQLNIEQLPDGTWPLRNSVTSDPAARVNWWQYAATSPLPQAGNGYFGTKDVLWKKA